jgi:hypothetical protein
VLVLHAVRTSRACIGVLIPAGVDISICPIIVTAATKPTPIPALGMLETLVGAVREGHGTRAS